MISMVDICGLCGLDMPQIAAIGEFEHLPDVAAAALAAYLLHTEHGLEKVRDMIVADIKTALLNQRTSHAAELIMALHHLYEQNPSLN